MKQLLSLRFAVILLVGALTGFLLGYTGVADRVVGAGAAGDGAAMAYERSASAVVGGPTGSGTASDVAPEVSAQTTESANDGFSAFNRCTASACSDAVVLDGVSAKGASRAAVSGDADIHVYFCAPRGRYTDEDLIREINNFNSSVRPFFYEQSSGLAEIDFVYGGIVSPDHADWEGVTLDQIFRSDHYSRQFKECEDLYDKHDDTLVLIDVHPGDVLGFAYRNAGFSMVAAPNMHPGNYDFYLLTVVHEIGHALFDLDHTREDSDPCTEDIIWSIMNAPECVGTHWVALDDFEIVCVQRQQLGWPCEGSSPGSSPESPGPVAPDLESPITPSAPDDLSPESPGPVAPDLESPITPSAPDEPSPEAPGPVAPDLESPITPFAPDEPSPVAPDLGFPIIPSAPVEPGLEASAACTGSTSVAYASSAASGSSARASVQVAGSGMAVVSGDGTAIAASAACCGAGTSVAISAQGVTVRSQRPGSCSSSASAVVSVSD